MVIGEHVDGVVAVLSQLEDVAWARKKNHYDNIRCLDRTKKV